MKIQRLTAISVIMLCFFSVCLGCGAKNRSTDTCSRTFSTDKEKIEFLKRYVTLHSPVKAAEFHIVYHDNATGRMPGPSDWNMKVALLVTPENIQAWHADFEEASIDHCDFSWAADVLPNESRWRRANLPRCYQSAKKPGVILSVYESEGILLKQMTSDAVPFEKEVQQASTDHIRNSPPITKQIPSFHLTMDVPQEVLLQEENINDVSLCIAGSSGTNYPSCVRITAVDEEVQEDFRQWRAVPLHVQGSLYYTEEHIAGTNGRQPVHLTALKGYLVLDTRYFRILASGYNKHGELNPTWCVPFLQTIRDNGEGRDTIEKTPKKHQD